MYEDVESEQYGTKQPVDHGIYFKNTKANKKTHSYQKLTGCSKSNSKRGFYSDTSLPGGGGGGISNKQPKLTCKGTRKRKTSKTQSQ